MLKVRKKKALTKFADRRRLAGDDRVMGVLAQNNLIII